MLIYWSNYYSRYLDPLTALVSFDYDTGKFLLRHKEAFITCALCILAVSFLNSNSWSILFPLHSVRFSLKMDRWAAALCNMFFLPAHRISLKSKHDSSKWTAQEISSSWAARLFLLIIFKALTGSQPLGWRYKWTALKAKLKKMGHEWLPQEGHCDIYYSLSLPLVNTYMDSSAFTHPSIVSAVSKGCRQCALALIDFLIAQITMCLQSRMEWSKAIPLATESSVWLLTMNVVQAGVAHYIAK